MCNNNFPDGDDRPPVGTSTYDASAGMFASIDARIRRIEKYRPILEEFLDQILMDVASDEGLGDVNALLDEYADRVGKK